MATKFHFDRVLDNISKMKKELPVVLANQAQNFFLSSFRKQGWEDNAVEPWKVPNRRIPGTKEYKYPKKKGLGRRTQATLIKTGRLRREVNTSIRSKTFEKVHLVVDTPYAARHNEGQDGMPKRQYMGQSRVLATKQIETINYHISRIWRE